MDADLKIIKHYLTRCMEGKITKIEGDVLIELNDAFDSLSTRLATLELNLKRQQPLRSSHERID